MYYNYWVRCVDSEMPQALALGQQLGLLDEDNNPTQLAKIWHVIGAIYIPTGETIIVDGMEIPVTTPKVDASGEEYWHANLTTDFNLLEYASNITDPIILAAVAERGSYFMPVAPNKPHVVRAL
jgi:hypothetical protein